MSTHPRRFPSWPSWTVAARRFVPMALAALAAAQLVAVPAVSATESPTGSEGTFPPEQTEETDEADPGVGAPAPPDDPTTTEQGPTGEPPPEGSSPPGPIDDETSGGPDAGEGTSTTTAETDLTDDFLGPGEGAEYVLEGNAWERTDLTFGFVNFTPDLTVAQSKAAFAGALAAWAAVTPLTFTEVSDCRLPFNHPNCTTPDIRIVFGRGDHGTGSSSDPDFDGPGGTVAHAYGPVPDAWGFTAGGDIHMDDAETWRASGAALDLQSVALHETGHALGLAHTDQSCAAPSGSGRPIMCPVLTGTQRVLAADDVGGAQALYGQPPPPLPDDAVEVDLIGPVVVPAEASGTEHRVRIANGYYDDLVGASLQVDGIAGCNQPAVSVPARTVVDSPCPIDTTGLLAFLDTRAAITVTATFTAIGIPDEVAGPVDMLVVPPGHPFSDVPAWLGPSVDWISFHELASGYAGGSYRPGANITRAQITRMVWRYGGEQAVADDHGFSDVPPWVEPAVRWAAHDPDGPGGEPALMSGFADLTFHPDDPITRGSVIRLLFRYAGSPDVAEIPDHGFSDVPPWVDPAVRWAAHDPDGDGPLEPIAAGFPDGTFGPNSSITRGQVTRMLYRLTDQLAAR